MSKLSESRRKRNWIGHVLRGDSLLKEIIEGTVNGKRKRGRKKIKMLDDLKKEGGCEPEKTS